MKEILIGVLALQGDFAKHIEMLKSLGVATKEVRVPKDLEQCDGLIIPGGESTVMLRQIDFIQLKDPIKNFAKVKPVFGTCAGLILISDRIQGSTMKPLQIMDIEVERNAFGRQVDSFVAPVELDIQGEVSRQQKHPKIFYGYFIRAPRIRATSSRVKVLASYKDEPILVREGFHLGATFHPELTDDPLIHRYFLDIVMHHPHIFQN